MLRWLASPAEVAEVVPGRPAAEAWAIALRAASDRALNAALGRLVARLGPAALASWVRPVGAEPLVARRAAGAPVVLVAWHAGVPAALPSGLVGLGLEALILRHHDGKDADGIRYATTRERTAVALQRAVYHLRQGGLVACVIEALPVPPTTARARSFLDRPVLIPPGPAAMARLGGATLLCAMPRRRGAHLELALADPGLVAGDDDACTTALTAWWDGYFRAHPSELWPDNVKALAAQSP
ncbi:MAG: hypothetical protein U1F43_11260 [Myxococcota bacterium]